eukprot:TRINITY_DN3721_c0_g1_i1.p1 TRINITY_DN3721_c0_g1~~TRINITY_DN3721_c0_g1_i1.p1  ORF type:complete len:198 (-),score=1.41 TRINITY_DN3721_c0_g1_i1:20-613(-)
MLHLHTRPLVIHSFVHLAIAPLFCRSVHVQHSCSASCVPEHTQTSSAACDITFNFNKTRIKHRLPPPPTLPVLLVRETCTATALTQPLPPPSAGPAMLPAENGSDQLTAPVFFSTDACCARGKHGECVVDCWGTFCGCAWGGGTQSTPSNPASQAGASQVATQGFVDKWVNMRGGGGKRFNPPLPLRRAREQQHGGP